MTDAGIMGLTTDELVALTVHQAWVLCREDEAAFAEMVGAVAASCAAYRGTTMPDPESIAQSFVAALEPMREAEGDQRFAFVIDKALAARGFEPMPAKMVAAYNSERNCKDKGSICHAPSTGLYFGRDGYATACCYSRANPLGRWPVQSVKQIWFGDRIRQMRSELRLNILPVGCENCADQLRAHNFKGLLAGNFDGFVSPSDTRPVNKPPDYPVSMEFELSNKCNLECAMCSGLFSSSIRANREGKPALPMVYDGRFVEQLKPFVPHLKKAKFLGGEPFLIDLYYEIWELFIQSNPACEIVITTNGTMFTNKVQRVLEHLNCQVIVSLDSIEKATYEGIRVNAVMERTLDHLERFMTLNRQRGKGLSIAVCPMVKNWREIPRIVSFANERGVSVFFNTVTFPETASLKFLRGDELLRVLDRFRAGIGSPRNEIEAGNYRALEDLCLQVEMWSADAAVGDSRSFSKT
jgi:MoaA/NifB/PqqE/SkfB family radical SAM enzyme